MDVLCSVIHETFSRPRFGRVRAERSFRSVPLPILAVSRTCLSSLSLPSDSELWVRFVGQVLDRAEESVQEDVPQEAAYLVHHLPLLAHFGLRPGSRGEKGL